MNKVQLNKIFQYNYSEDKLEYTAISSKALTELASMKGISMKDISEEIKKREIYLIENSENKRTTVYETKKIINDYYNNNRQ